MIYSMTAFAREQSQSSDPLFFWEIKSVNHRYLDLSFRMPESFRFIEGHLRHRLRGKIHRGKVDCHLKVNENTLTQKPLTINTALVKSLLEAGQAMASSQALPDDLAVSHLLAWPGVVDTAQPDLESLGQEVEQVFERAVNQLMANRLVEGRALKEHIEIRLQQLNQDIHRARAYVETISSQAKEKLLSRLHRLQMDVTEIRVEQEIALLLTRLDISEELDRLQTHVSEVTRILDSDDRSGRRLDFLMQELNREANTLSSKSDSAALTQIAVEMKVGIEQMREQIQNIE